MVLLVQVKQYNNKRIDKKITTHNVENEESLKKTLDYFREVG